MGDLKNGNGRIEVLKERQKQIQVALAAEHLKRQKQMKRDAEKLEAIIGAAVVRAAAVFPELQRMVAETALANVTEEKQRQFLKDRGWNV